MALVFARTLMANLQMAGKPRRARRDQGSLSWLTAVCAALGSPEAIHGAKAVNPDDVYFSQCYNAPSSVNGVGDVLGMGRDTLPECEQLAENFNAAFGIESGGLEMVGEQPGSTTTYPAPYFKSEAACGSAVAALNDKLAGMAQPVEMKTGWVCDQYACFDYPGAPSWGGAQQGFYVVSGVDSDESCKRVRQLLNRGRTVSLGTYCRRTSGSHLSPLRPFSGSGSCARLHLDQYDASDPDADFDAIDTTRQASEEIEGADQVDSIMSHPFELNDTERADAVKTVTFVIPN